MKDKLNKLGKTLKKWAKEFWYFISSLLFLKNLGGMIGALLLFLGITVLFLKCYTRHGDTLQVNDFVGMTYKEAQAVANKVDFELEIMDSVFIPEREPGMVLDQSPKPMSQVKEGRSIYLTVTKFQADMVELPVFSESSYDFKLYEKKLHRKNIKTKIVERVFDARQASNSIVYLMYDGEKYEDADIKKGVEVPMGSTLEFVVTKRESSVVQIPNLVCQAYDEAKFLITNSSLQVGDVVEDNSVTSQASAYVWKQEPSYARQKMIDKGARIKIYLTQYQPDDCN